MAPSSPLEELNALLDAFIPLTQKVSIAKTTALEKEGQVLEKILTRVWMVMPHMAEDGQEPDYRNKLDIINHTEKSNTGDDSGYRISNKLILYEDGRLTRSHVIERWGQDGPSFEFNDEKEMNCIEAVRCFGFEEICAGLVDVLKCQCSLDVEYKALQNRIERADSLISVIGEKFKAECEVLQ